MEVQNKFPCALITSPQSIKTRLNSLVTTEKAHEGICSLGAMAHGLKVSGRSATADLAVEVGSLVLGLADENNKLKETLAEFHSMCDEFLLALTSRETTSEELREHVLELRRLSGSETYL